MVHRELIPFDEYEDEFGVPYMADFAKACREYITVNGVKNCFILEAPLFLPGEKKPLQIVFQRKGPEVFECSDNGGIAKVIQPKLENVKDLLTEYGIEYKNDRLLYTLYAEDNLKDWILKWVKLLHIWSDDSSEGSYGIQFPFRQASGDFYYLTVRRNFIGSFTISDSGLIQPTDNVDKLSKTYEIEKEDGRYAITLPNIHTRYAVRRLLDMFQFVFLANILE